MIGIAHILNTPQYVYSFPGTTGRNPSSVITVTITVRCIGSTARPAIWAT